MTYLFNKVVDAIVTPRSGESYSFNNYGINPQRGFTIPASMVPVLSLQTRTGFQTSDVTSILDYTIGLNGQAGSTMVYAWYEGDITITGPAPPAWTNFGTRLSYRFYTDWNGSQTGNSFIQGGSILRHSGIIVGRVSDSDFPDISLHGGSTPNLLTLCAARADASQDIDFWIALTLKEYS